MDAVDWNIVVLGHWNRAILTPNWIAEKVFGLAAGTPIDVLVPLDGFAPFQVQHAGLIVVPAPSQLLFQLGAPTRDLLAKAAECATRSISALPQTPLRACGVNLRFGAPAAPEALTTRTRCSTEQLLSDSGYEIQVRRRGETVSFRGGAANVIVDIPTAGPVTLNVNFERQSTSNDDLLGWLGHAPDVFMTEARRIADVFAG